MNFSRRNRLALPLLTLAAACLAYWLSFGSPKEFRVSESVNRQMIDSLDGTGIFYDAVPVRVTKRRWYGKQVIILQSEWALVELEFGVLDEKLTKRRVSLTPIRNPELRPKYDDKIYARAVAMTISRKMNANDLSNPFIIRANNSTLLPDDHPGVSVGIVQLPMKIGEHTTFHISDDMKIVEVVEGY